MQVFSMFDPSNPMRVVDLFVDHAIPFEELWSRSEVLELRDTTVRVAGRTQDHDDIAQLEAILATRRGHHDD